jgi:tetratricopeptide (TPR) repeat protein
MKPPRRSASAQAKIGSSLGPTQLQLLLREAAEHRVARRYDQAVALYRQVEQHNPDALDAPYFIALIDLARERPADALPRLEALARLMPREAKIWTALAYARRELGRWDSALEALDQAQAINPTEALSDRATVLEVIGRMDDALDVYRRMQAHPAERISGLIGIANLKPAEIAASDREVMTQAAFAADTDIDTKIQLWFALGAVADQVGETDAAFDAFAAGNRLKRRTLIGELPRLAPPIGPQPRAISPEQSAEEQRLAIAFRKAIFTRDFIAEYEGRGHHIAAPIFIVGMPRSGTTLLEQILSSHRRVQGLGESAALSQSARGRYPFDLFAPNPPDHFRSMAEAYFKAMHARGWGNAPRFVDKALRNYVDIGLIHLMLPKAVILHSVRDPVDTCLACYRKLFVTSQEASYDLGDIGREYVAYREMMDHWATVLPGRVVDVGHEALVADPERQIRQLVVESCSLEWDPACLRFYETKRPVRTASVAQVRQPIFTTSIERWRRYEKHLGPLFEALGPYAPADKRSLGSSK